VRALAWYDFYCDESGIDGGADYWLGALQCSPVRARMLAEKLAAVRDYFDLRSEMKWTRVSRAFLPAYKAFVDVALDDLFTTFFLIQVERGNFWKQFGQDEQARFFKSYYVFLRLNMLPYSRYNVYVDNKEGKRYRWSNVQYAINGAYRRRHELSKKQVPNFTPLDSRTSDLLQVVDVVMGAASSSATASHKVEFSDYVRERLARNRHLSKPKLVQRVWSPRPPGQPHNQTLQWTGSASCVLVNSKPVSAVPAIER